MGLIEYLVIASSFVFLGEGLNCSYPMHDGQYENSGIVCQWEHESFYYEPDSCKWILKEFNEDDNWVEAMSRRKYWQKRGE